MTRVSLGAQSFQPRLLEVLDRVAGPDDVRRAVYVLRDAGFDNISLDLIYGIPGQSAAELDARPRRGARARARAPLRVRARGEAGHALHARPRSRARAPGRVDGVLLRARRRDADRAPATAGTRRRTSAVDARPRAGATCAPGTTSATGSGTTTSGSAWARSARSRIAAGGTHPRCAATSTASRRASARRASSRSCRPASRETERVMLGLRLDEPVTVAVGRRGRSTGGARAARAARARDAARRHRRADAARALPRRRRHGDAARLTPVATARPGAATRLPWRYGHERATRCELSERQREILRSASSRSTSRRARRSARSCSSSGPAFEVSSSTVRAELAELERLGLLTHPHTSAGRVPTEAGYRLYVDALLARAGARARRSSRSSSRRQRTEVEEALQATTEMLSQVTRLLALVSAPPLEAATVRHVDVLQLQPNVVVVVVITSTGEVTKQRYAFDEPARPGTRHLGGRLPARAPDRAPAALAPARARVRRAERVAPASGRSWPIVRGAFDDRRGRARALRRRRRRAPRRPARRGDRRLPEPDRRAREARRTARRARAVARPRSGPFVAGRRRARAVRACTSWRSSVPPTATRTSRSARSACSGRCAWTTRRRSRTVRSAAYELSRFVEEVYADE